MPMFEAHSHLSPHSSFSAFRDPPICFLAFLGEQSFLFETFRESLLVLEPSLQLTQLDISPLRAQVH